MSNELDHAKELMRQARPEPRSEARDAALAAAMDAFDAEFEKSKSAAQGSAEQNRQREQAPAILRGAKALWSSLMTPISQSYRGVMAGGASVAVLVLAVFSLDAIQTGPVPILPIGTDQQSVLSPEPGEKPAPDAEVASKSAPQPVIAERAASAPSAVPAPPAAIGGQFNTFSGAPRQAQGIAAQPGGQTQGLTRGVGTADLIAPPAYEDIGRDRFANDEPNRFKRVTESPVSTFSVDVDTASYAFMRASLNNGVLPPKESIRTEEWINYFDYDYGTTATPGAPFGVDVAVMPTPWNAGTQILRIGIEGYDLPAETVRRSANLVFLIDTSGSMQSPDKLPLLKNAFRLLVAELRPDDRVSIVAYAGDAGTVLEPTAASDKVKILEAIDNLAPGGSTAGGEGLRQAYALARQTLQDDGVNRVILATDGDFNVGFSDNDSLTGFIERQRDTGVSLSVLGFGRGNLNDSLMQTLAQNGNGNAAYIDTLAEAQKVLVDEVTANLFTIASDVKVQVEFNPAVISEYRLIGYETRALNREDFANDKVDAGEIGAGHTVTALYEVIPVGSAAERIGALRYGNETNANAQTEPNAELAFIKVRAKLPGESESRLYEVPVTSDAVIDTIAAADDNTRFAAAVAGFAEVLTGGVHTGGFTLDDVRELARGAKGEDAFGYRAEFIRLLGLAKSAQALPASNR
ncbi:MAG: VWA domain-containing protein [Pseudomonadota bacterium]